MTVSRDNDHSQYIHPDDDNDTRIQLVEGEMYDHDNRITYLEDNLAELTELVKELYTITLSDPAGNTVGVEQRLDPSTLDLSICSLQSRG